MKIEVYHNEADGWAWKIVQPGVGTVALSNHINYDRKSDAKRGAARFEQKVHELYGSPGDIFGMPIEVIE